MQTGSPQITVSTWFSMSKLLTSVIFHSLKLLLYLFLLSSMSFQLLLPAFLLLLTGPREMSHSIQYSIATYCPACRTTLVATRFRVAVICPIIQVPHCIRVFFYFVWFVFINHIFQFYYELCTYCNILDIYLSSNLNFVNYVLFYMKLLNYLFFSMFGSVLESCELTGVCLLLPWLIKWK